jgi:hypothetical protein
MNPSPAAAEPPGLLRGGPEGKISLLARARSAILAVLNSARLPRRNAPVADEAGKVIYLRKIIPRFGVLNLSRQVPISEVIVVVYESPRGGRIFPRIQVTEIA